MCGIVGILGSGAQDHPKLPEALSIICHRGPDDSGIHSDSHVALGHVRLSILDLSPLGHQPMTYAEGRYVTVFNGEVYNFIELRAELENLGHRFRSRSDTEVLLASYSQWGVDCLQKLRGMFAFAIWDTRDKRLFLARDRCGEKPLVYRLTKDRLIFASELKALVQLDSVEPEFDPEAVDLYFHYQFVPEPRTPLKGVFKLPAGHYMVVDSESMQAQTKCYWRFEDAPAIHGDPVPAIREELDRSIELTLRSDVPVGVALSGGIDSSAIAALAAPKHQDVLRAFSIGYPGRPAQDERGMAEELAKKLGLPFHDVELDTQELVDFFPTLVRVMDDPIADIAAFGHYMVTRAAADQGVKVMLTGIGGDELFWGYYWLPASVQQTMQRKQGAQQWSPPFMVPFAKKFLSSRAGRFAASSPRMPKMISSAMRSLEAIATLDPARADYAVFYDLIQDFNDMIKLSQRELYTPEFKAAIPPDNAISPYRLDMKGTDNIQHAICRLLFDTWLVSNCLNLGDKVSMASSVETRLPLLDYRLVEIAMGARKTQEDHNIGPKAWFKEALKDVLSDEVLNRPKKGFTPPVEDWIHSLIGRYQELLLDGWLLRLGVLDDNHLKRHLSVYATSWPSAFLLYKALLLELWWRQVVLAEHPEV
ncbi:MAG: asparagine synthase (glutamine-hydrolyzing) [Okeania sp. SIO3B3]|nr:asparagine synthase (glutamine-hydrolyzing) [Okeania sp. SIO3B3]